MDLTQFHDAFYEESAEAIAQMEQSLLRLDVGTPDIELINTIFRVAHSIKGGAATFGFNDIASFTHSLETLLDELRAQRLKVTAALSDLLLRSVDVMREMLRAQQATQPLDAQRIADLQFDIEMAVAQGNAVAEPAAVAAASSADALPAPAHERSGSCYLIHFRPFLHLLARGNDPLRLFRELRGLGELEVSLDCAALPALDALDPERCYLNWSLKLWTEVPQQSIREVFDWAEGDCDLEIHAIAAAAAVSAMPITQAMSPIAGAAAQTTLPAAPAASPAALEPPRTSAPRAPSEPAKLGDAASIRVGIDKIDELMNSVGELVITRSMLGELGALIEGAIGERLRAGLSQLERDVRGLQESVMRVRMVPISFVFSRFPRMVRDLAQRLDKQVELRLSGADTELDKTVMEKIGDPLTHLVRNCIDHGIESTQQRIEQHKPACGTVHLHAYHRGSSIIIEVSDDGGGLKRERILAKARERGLIGADEQPSPESICNLIFLAGFSTNEQANDVSGRGVGMDVVKRNVDELGGSIEVRSEAGKGTRFIITLPLTLAIVDGQSIAIGTESYIVPLAAIIESVQLRGASLTQVVGHGEVLAFRGEYLPVLRLQQLFKVRTNPAFATDKGLIMVVEGDGRRFGLCVDELLGQQQVVVKTLNANYGPVEGIAGATILGDGSVALILDIVGLTRTLAARVDAIAA
jgi:two-component system, chemotaxis family, sensor kinase CheA